MYARKREKELKKIKPEPTQPIGMSLRAPSGPPNHAKYVLKSLEDIDASKRLSSTMLNTTVCDCVFLVTQSCTAACSGSACYLSPSPVQWRGRAEFGTGPGCAANSGKTR